MATKFKLGVKFGTNYNTMSLTIHEQAINGYEMLYNLISHLHPRLMRNKAIKPPKLIFDGNMHALT